LQPTAESLFRAEILRGKRFLNVLSGHLAPQRLTDLSSVTHPVEDAGNFAGMDMPDDG
jgi:hypothetical protein